MEPIAVEFHRKPVTWPAAVNPATAGHAIRDREREVRFLELLEEALFESAQSDRHVAAEDLLELFSPWRIRKTAQNDFDLPRRGAIGTPASWQARASAGSGIEGASSTSVRGMLVSGIPRQSAISAEAVKQR
jgi:hypothetical protein